MSYILEIEVLNVFGTWPILETKGQDILASVALFQTILLH